MTTETSSAISSSAVSEGARYWLAVKSLAARELVRFFRQRTRVVGALGQPILFWILFGAGLRGSFQAPEWAPEGMTYQEYFFPGVVVMIVMFTSIFSTISLIEDRREGFLQGVLVAPVPRSAIVMGKLLGGTVLAVLQAALFLLIGPMLELIGMAPAMQIDWGISNVLATGLFLVLLSFTLTGLGYLIAWPMESTQGFHAIMSVFLMPMWLLSGSFFPVGGAGWLSWVMACNPLTYGVAGLRQLMYWNLPVGEAGGLPSVSICVGVTLLFCVVTTSVAVYMTGKRKSSDQR